MMDVFYDAASHVLSKPVADWKESGKQVVGYTCSYVPSEIFHAAHLLPVRIRGIETDSMEIGDAYFGPYICTFPKCILQLAGKGRFSFLDGAVITPGCDSMRRLDECWRKAGEDYEGIVPPFFYYFDVPHKTEAHGMKWFVAEIRRLIAAVEKHFHVEITDEMLRHSITVYNKGRTLLAELEALRQGENTPISGTDAFAVTIAGTVMPREAYTEALETLLQSLRGHAPLDVKRRLMLLGSISDDIDLVRLIEDDAEAVVVAENLCFGVRYEGIMIAEEGDPVTALARGYLGESTCPRMYGKYNERLAILKEVIAQSDVEGVIMQNIRFCDLHGSENGLFKRDLQASGIPCLQVEREYGPLVETGRLKMRIDAFLERIS